MCFFFWTTLCEAGPSFVRWFVCCSPFATVGLKISHQPAVGGTKSATTSTRLGVLWQPGESDVTEGLAHTHARYSSRAKASQCFEYSSLQNQSSRRDKRGKKIKKINPTVALFELRTWAGRHRGFALLLECITIDIFFLCLGLCLLLLLLLLPHVLVQCFAIDIIVVGRIVITICSGFCSQIYGTCRPARS